MAFLELYTAGVPDLSKGSDAELDAARDTDVALVPGEPEAMEDGPPERGAPPDVDPRVRLGLSNRSTSSFAVPSEKGPPPWAGNTEVGQVRGDDIPSAGSAAQREMAGQFGHGSMAYLVGIAPYIGASPEFGSEYFVVHDRDINENATAREWGIQPPGVGIGELHGDAAYAMHEMVAARHAAETGAGYDLNGLWD